MLIYQRYLNHIFFAFFKINIFLDNFFIHFHSTKIFLVKDYFLFFIFSFKVNVLLFTFALKHITQKRCKAPFTRRYK